MQYENALHSSFAIDSLEKLTNSKKTQKNIFKWIFSTICVAHTRRKSYTKGFFSRVAEKKYYLHD